MNAEKNPKMFQATYGSAHVTDSKLEKITTNSVEIRWEQHCYSLGVALKVNEGVCSISLYLGRRLPGYTVAWTVLYTRGYPKLASNFTTQLILSINASSLSDFTNNKIIFQMFTEWLNVWLHLILLSQLIFSNNNTYFTIYMRFIVCIKVKRCYWWTVTL